MAGYHCFIFSVQAVIRQLRRQSLVRHVVLCRNNEPRYFLSMRWTMPGLRSPPMPERGCPRNGTSARLQVCRPACTGRVDNHAAGLVDNDNVRILIDDVERDIPRLSGECPAFQEGTAQLLPRHFRGNSSSAAGRQAGQPRVQTFLDLAAGILWQNTGKESVDTFSALLDCYLYYALVHYLNSLSISSRSKSVLLSSRVRRAAPVSAGQVRSA